MDRRLTAAWLACAMLGAGWGDVAFAHETIERVKGSVVAVGTLQRTRVPPFKFLGTGFAVGDGRSIVTNAHVVGGFVDSGAEPETLAILLPTSDPGSARAVEVARSALDEEHDLAILKLAATSLPAMTLSASDNVRDGDEFFITGFPIGAVLGPVPATHRVMIAAVTPIAMPPPTRDSLDAKVVRRLQRGPFAVYQLDGTAYPGNSGSPLYDAKTGEVAAVVNMVLVKGVKESALAQPSGISYAIPVRYVRELLAKLR